MHLPGRAFRMLAFYLPHAFKYPMQNLQSMVMGAVEPALLTQRSNASLGSRLAAPAWEPVSFGFLHESWAVSSCSFPSMGAFMLQQSPVRRQHWRVKGMDRSPLSMMIWTEVSLTTRPGHHMGPVCTGKPPLKLARTHSDSLPGLNSLNSHHCEQVEEEEEVLVYAATDVPSGLAPTPSSLVSGGSQTVTFRHLLMHHRLCMGNLLATACVFATATFPYENTCCFP